MGFCTNCGTKLEDTQRFCTSCGASQVTSEQAAPTAATSDAAAAPGLAPATQVQPAQSAGPKSGGALKIVLIILGVLVLLGLIAGGAIAYIGYRASKSIRVDANGNATVETPWGKVSTGQDNGKIAEQLGVPLYPGAKQLEGSGEVSFGDNLSFGNAEFETSDSLDKVEQFYRKRLPNAKISAVDEEQRAIAATTNKTMVTISLERSGDKTIIRIVKAAASGSGTGSSE
jgi:hypothetical protein